MIFQRHSRCGSCASVSPVAEDRDNFRQSEIQNLGVTTLGDENVCGLDVPMHDASGVGSIERVSNLNAQRQHCFNL